MECSCTSFVVRNKSVSPMRRVHKDVRSTGGEAVFFPHQIRVCRNCPGIPWAEPRHNRLRPAGGNRIPPEIREIRVPVQPELPADWKRRHDGAPFRRSRHTILRELPDFRRLCAGRVFPLLKTASIEKVSNAGFTADFIPCISSGPIGGLSRSRCLPPQLPESSGPRRAPGTLSPRRLPRSDSG